MRCDPFHFRDDMRAAAAATATKRPHTHTHAQRERVRFRLLRRAASHAGSSLANKQPFALSENQ
eukprot:555835-Prorocentrum_minimum.AAC.2